MKKSVIIDTENLTIVKYSKANFLTDEVTEHDKVVIPIHVIKLVQKAYDSDGISSVAVFFETDDNEFFFTQNDIENDIEELFNDFISVRNKLLLTQDYINIYRIEEYNIESRETKDL